MLVGPVLSKLLDIIETTERFFPDSNTQGKKHEFKFWQQLSHVSRFAMHSVWLSFLREHASLVTPLNFGIIYKSELVFRKVHKSLLSRFQDYYGLYPEQSSD